MARKAPSRFIALNVVGLALAVAGCGSNGSSSFSVADAKACFESDGYTTNDQPELGFADVGPDDWFDVVDADGEDVVTVAYFEDTDAVSRAKGVLAVITKSAAEAFDIDVSDSDIDELVRTSGNYLYWWNSETATNEADVERCMRP